MATIQFKRGSTNNLQNIIPAAGEPVWDKELKKLKIGDGTSLYSVLPYVGEDTFLVDNVSIKLNDNSEATLFNFDLAEDGMSPVKQNGILKWTVLASKNEVDTISATINERIIGIQSELIEHENRIEALENQMEGIRPEDIQEALEKAEAAAEVAETFDGQLDLIEHRLSELEGDHDKVEAIDSQINGENGLVDRIEALEDSDEGAMHFVGEIIKEPGESDLDAIARVIPNPNGGDTASVSGKEYFYNGTSWTEFGIDSSVVYTTDDILILDGGTAKTSIIDAHDPITLDWED